MPEDRAADGDGTVHAFALSNGDERWTYDAGSSSIEAEVVGDAAYVAAGDGERGRVARIAVGSGTAGDWSMPGQAPRRGSRCSTGSS